MSALRAIFIAPGQSPTRLRAGWRLAIQTALLLILFFGLGIPVDLLALIFHWDLYGVGYLLLDILVELLAITVSVFLARHFLDRRSFVSLGFEPSRRVLPDLFFGVVISLIMLGTIYGVMLAFGWIRFHGFAWQFDPLPLLLGQLALYLVIFLIGGFQEELLSRGYQLQTLASGANLFWGVLLSSVIFSFLHLANPDATWVSTAGIFFAGLFLALGYLRTGQLWLSIGLHFGWNYFEGVVFGFPVSGTTSYHLLRISVAGPTLWTGGDFGPEAGLIVLPALLLGAILILLYSKFRTRIPKSDHLSLLK